MAAGTYNILVEQGSTFSQSVTVKEDGSPRDLTGYNARAQMRPTRTSSTLTATFTCTISDPTTGLILMELTPATTAAIAEGRYYYDLEIYTNADGIVTRLLQGEVTVSPEVTR
jgi:hypothetical protein